MTDKQDLIKQAEKLQQELDILKKKIEQCDKTEYIRWRIRGEDYFYLNYEGVSYSVTNTNSYADNWRFNTGNYFKTRQEAEDYKENLITKQKLKDLALRLNKGVKMDWDDISQSKFFIFFNTISEKLEYALTSTKQDVGNVYCLKINFLDIAIKEIGEDKLIKLIESGV